MTEWRLFDPENKPEWLDSEWWTGTDNCNHLDNRVHQARLEAVASEAERCVQLVGRGSKGVTDLGAGDGGMLSLLGNHIPAKGYEIIKDSVRYAKEVRDVDVEEAHVTRDVYYLRLNKVVTCTEFLEHLEDPHGFLRTLARRRQDFNYLIASSPFREDNVDHQWNHAWAWDMPGYARMIEDAGFKIMDQYPVEWSQVVVARLP